MTEWEYKWKITEFPKLSVVEIKNIKMRQYKKIVAFFMKCR